MFKKCYLIGVKTVTPLATSKRKVAERLALIVRLVLSTNGSLAKLFMVIRV